MGAEGWNSGFISRTLDSDHRHQKPRSIMRMRHSRVENFHDEDDVADRENLIKCFEESKNSEKSVLEQSSDMKEAEEENWSLFDLLSRSASARSQNDRQSSSQNSFAVHRRSHPENSPLESNGFFPRFRNGILPLSKLHRADHSFDETHEDADTEDNCESECGLSAASSISWAEDAVEAEQTENLARLWNEVEQVCGGGPRPEKMSDQVYEECILWRQAFPEQTSSPSYRFESMQEFLRDEDEDTTPTPTNDFSLVEPNACSDLTHSSTPTPQAASKDLVAAWLTECSQHDEVEAQVPTTTCSDGSLTTVDVWRASEAEAKPGSSGLRTRLIAPTTVISIPENDEGMRRIGKAISEEESPDAFRPFTATSSTDEPLRRVRPSQLPIPIPRESNFIGRKDSSKPFLLWLFDNVS